MPKPQISATIANIVITATVDCKLDLDKIISIPGATIPEHFPAVIFRPPPEHPGRIQLGFGKKRLKDEANPCILVFSSGKMVCPGTKNVEQAKALVRRFMKDLRAHGVALNREPTYKVSNVVASGSLGGFVNLEAAATKLHGIIFEPDQFPGLIYRMEDPHAVFLLFTSGKFVCPGAPDESTIHNAARKMRSILEQEGLIAYVDP